MTDQEKLSVALTARDESHDAATVTVGDVVAMLYELGAQYRETARRQLLLKAAS